LLIISVFLFSFCGDSGPFAPEPTPPPPHVPAANIVLDGDLVICMTSYDCPKFEGYVKNTGDGVGYNCEVDIRVYSDTSKTTIIDTASGFPANLGNIDPGQRAWFDAVCFELDSISQIVAYDVNITWLNR
jgi:hypothetical protein